MDTDRPQIGPLFRSQEDWWNNACLNWTHDSLELYVVGYREAAELLVETALDKKKPIDALVYPIIFLYRHYFELRLKELIRESRRLLGQQSDFPQHHKIGKLWQGTRSLLTKVFENESEPLDFSVIDHVIHEISDIDPLSFSFRYPRDKTGNNPLKGITHINIRQFAESVRKAAELLDGASIGVSYYQDLQNDMYSY